NGYKLQRPDAEQASWAPVDTVEMGLPESDCIAFRLQTAGYKQLVVQVWGNELDIAFPGNTEQICDTPGGASIFHGSATPVLLSPQDRAKADRVYDNWGQSISFLEASPDVSPYTSKVDANINGLYTCTPNELSP